MKSGLIRKKWRLHQGYSKAGFLDGFKLVCLLESQAAMESRRTVFSNASDVQTVQENEVFLISSDIFQL